MHESRQAVFTYFEDEDSNLVNGLISQNLIKFEPYPNSSAKTLPIEPKSPLRILISNSSYVSSKLDMLSKHVLNIVDSLFLINSVKTTDS